jgi:hypothetical protein
VFSLSKVILFSLTRNRSWNLVISIVSKIDGLR